MTRKQEGVHLVWKLDIPGARCAGGIEGICYTIRNNVELMKAHGLPMRRIFAVGGGTKNALWLQCLADILEQEVCVPAVSFGAAYGDALMAALARRNFCRLERTFHADTGEKNLYPESGKFFSVSETGKIFPTNFTKRRRTICINCPESIYLIARSLTERVRPKDMNYGMLKGI